MEEEWRHLIYPKIKEEHNHYSISSHGRLRNDNTNNILKPSILSSGYYSVRVTLGSKKSKIHIIIHKAVAYTFLENPENYNEVNHIDANKLNNNVENLEWCSSHHNQQHKFDIGSYDKSKISGENNHKSKLTYEAIKDIRENYVRGSRTHGAHAFARKYGVSYVTVYYALQGRTWKNIPNE